MEAGVKSQSERISRKTVLLTSGISVLVSLMNIGAVAYEHSDTQRAHISDELWRKRTAAYEKMLDISLQTASKVRTKEEYEDLLGKYYEVLGPLELYSSHHVVSCSTKLRDQLIACANPDVKNREVCSFDTLKSLQFRLSAEMRISLGSTTNQTPADYQEDRFGTSTCDVN